MTQCAWRGKETTSVAMTPQEYAAKNRIYEELIPQLLAHGAIILDPIPSMQSRTGSAELLGCDAGGIFYQDFHHLSPYGAKSLEPMFQTVVDAIVARPRDLEPTPSATPRETPAPVLTTDAASGPKTMR